MLLRDDSFLDRVQQVRKVVFDKTGTITRGQLRLTQSSLEVLASLDPKHRRVLQSMVSRSNHPASRCVAEAIPSVSNHSGEHVESLSADDLGEIPGMGLCLTNDGHEYRFGRTEFVLGSDGESGGFAGATFGIDGRAVVTLEFEEDLRPDACSEVEALHEMGLSVHLFSGDNKPKVALVASKLGLGEDRTLSDLSPEQKAAAVASLVVFQVGRLMGF